MLDQIRVHCSGEIYSEWTHEQQCKNRAPCTCHLPPPKGVFCLQRWSDIGYSFLIGGDGRVYEGRGWGRVGAHTGGYNSVGYGVSFIGTFTSAYPNQAMIATYERFQRVSIALICKDTRMKNQFCSKKCAERDGHLRSSWKLCGHRDVSSTACPGTLFWTNYVKRHPKYGVR